MGRQLGSGGRDAREVTAGLLVLDLLLIEEAGEGDNVGVDLFAVAVFRHGD